MIRTTPTLEQIETLFHQALLIDDGIERLEWLARRCQQDTRLFDEVVSLLDAHDAMASSPSVERLDEAPAVPDEMFGPYQPVKLLGRGGMSAVYLAKRADGRFEQAVAIKVMGAHLAGDDFRKKFETEGRFLAALRHPHITTLVDGGISRSGHPYLAMEYVEGEAIDVHCDRKKLGTGARSALFLQVADAVEYAHRNLILHRDLKPGNILVTDDGQVKLLDFGTAGLLGGTAAVTVTRARMLTPRYASPEQLRGERPGVAGDVFSLGVILYELLTGKWPFGDPDSVVNELERATGRLSPARPLSIDGDLAVILMKALESEPSERYLTVREFAEDIERYVEGRPVMARPQTSLYRVGKFVRRRWIAVGATAVFVIGISAAAIIAAMEARSARAEAVKSEEINRFLTEMLATGRPYGNDAGKYTVEQMLEEADQRLRVEQTKSQNGAGGPLALAVLHKSLAIGYLGQQRYDKARLHLDLAMPVFKSSGDDRDLAEALVTQATVDTDQGRYEEANRSYLEAIERFEHMGRAAPRGELFETKRQRAYLLSLLMQRGDEANRLYDELIATGARDRSIPRVAVANAIANRGLMLQGAGKFKEAEALTLEALDMGRKEDPGGGWEFDPLFTLTTIYSETHNYPAGKEVAKRMVEVSERNRGAESATAAQAKNIWAWFAAMTGESGPAAEAMRDSMRILEKVIPLESLNLWYAARNASNVMRLAGQNQDAERYARESLASAEAAHVGAKDARIGNSWEALARALAEEKKYPEAVAAFGKAEAAYHQPGWLPKAGIMQKLAAQAQSAAR